MSLQHGFPGHHRDSMNHTLPSSSVEGSPHEREHLRHPAAGAHLQLSELETQLLPAHEGHGRAEQDEDLSGTGGTTG